MFLNLWLTTINVGGTYFLSLGYEATASHEAQRLSIQKTSERNNRFGSVVPVSLALVGNFVSVTDL